MLKRKDFRQFHIASKVTLGGGLALISKHDFDLTVDTSSLNHIDAIINKGKEEEWCFTSFMVHRKLINTMNLGAF